jgi:CTP synthase (UTP-ammonia lyase)
MTTILAIGDRDPRQFTHRELDAAFALIGDEIDCRWTASDSAAARDLDRADGIWLLPGSPYRDDDAADAAIVHCLRTGTPYLGTCAGFQYACVQLAIALAGRADAAHAERAPGAADPVVERLACSLYGERRTVTPVPGTKLAAACGEEPFEGFHWCGFGLAATAAETLRDAGVTLAAHAPDAGVEAIELPDHPFFVATAFQPQVGAGERGGLHPLIATFLAAAAAHAASAASPRYLADSQSVPIPASTANGGSSG